MSPYLRKEQTEDNVLTLDEFPPQSSGSNVSVPGLQQQQPRSNKALDLNKLAKRSILF